MKTVAPFLRLNSNDVGKGLIMAFMGAIITGVMTSLTANPPSFPADWMAWKPIVLGGIAMTLSYYTKNFLTNSKDQFLKKEDAPRI